MRSGWIENFFLFYFYILPRTSYFQTAIFHGEGGGKVLSFYFYVCCKSYVMKGESNSPIPLSMSDERQNTLVLGLKKSHLFISKKYRYFSNPFFNPPPFFFLYEVSSIPLKCHIFLRGKRMKKTNDQTQSPFHLLIYVHIIDLLDLDRI